VFCQFIEKKNDRKENKRKIQSAFFRQQPIFYLSISAC